MSDPDISVAMEADDNDGDSEYEISEEILEEINSISLQKPEKPTFHWPMDDNDIAHLKMFREEINSLGKREDDSDEGPVWTSPEPSNVEEEAQDQESIERSARLMFKGLIDCFERVEKGKHVSLPGEDWRGLLLGATKDVGAQPLHAFHSILVNLQFMQQSCKRADFTLATLHLVKGSRYEPWRLLYGELGLLDFYLDFFNEHHTPDLDDLDENIVRIIANCCVEYDANRERILKKLDLSILIKNLLNNKRVYIATHALYNICCGYEPGKEKARSHQLFAQIVAMFDDTSHPFKWELLGQICSLLSFAVIDFDVEKLPDHSVKTIYGRMRTKKLYFDEEKALSTAMFTLLSYDKFRECLIHDKMVDIFTTFLLDTYNLDFHDIPYDRRTKYPKLNDDQMHTIAEMRQKSAAILWDIAAHQDFIKYYPMSHELMENIIGWLSRPEPGLQLAACNILRVSLNDERAAEFFGWKQRESRIKTLTALIRHPTNPEILVEGLRLLSNLARPKINRPLLCSRRTLMNFLLSLGLHAKTLRIQMIALKITRLILQGDYENTVWFLEVEIYEDAQSPYLCHLISLYLQTDELPLQMEIALLFVEIFRTNHELDKQHAVRPYQSHRDVNLGQKAVLQARRGAPGNTNVAIPIFGMITKSDNQSLVTQGWLGLALMAGTREGAKAVFRLILGPAAKQLPELIKSLKPGSPDWSNAKFLYERLDNQLLIPLMQRSQYYWRVTQEEYEKTEEYDQRMQEYRFRVAIIAEMFEFIDQKVDEPGEANKVEVDDVQGQRVDPPSSEIPNIEPST
ncbi:hypothetical protein ACLMJK_004560 [Lecanora helva]